MTALPALNLKVSLAVLGVNATWDQDDGTGDLFVGYPYRWNVILMADPQIHSSHLTRIPTVYDGDDIKVGQWISGALMGFAWQIVEITQQNSSSIECVIEDVERLNLFTDNQLLGAPPVDGDAIVFDLDNTGQPILSSVPQNMFDATYYGALASRFAYRNTRGDNTRVYQVGHTLLKDDMIFMDSTGAFQTLRADATNKLNLGSIVGQVTDSSTDWFTYKPRGEIRYGVNLPADSVPGQLIYLDPVNLGKLTATRPTKLATPLYIRLQDAHTGIYMGAGSGGGAVDEDELRFATVYRVADLAARALIDSTKLKEGDQAYVSDAGQGEWALFMVSKKVADPLAITWTKITDLDASNVDGRTVGVDIRFDSSPPIDVYRISPTDRVTVVTVDVVAAFHPSATLTVGDDADHERLVQDQHIDLSVVDTYTITPSYQYGGTDESWVRAYLNRGSSTSGQVRVTISYI